MKPVCRSVEDHPALAQSHPLRGWRGNIFRRYRLLPFYPGNHSVFMHGLGEEKALQFVATEILKNFPLPLCFDALGDDTQVQHMRQIDHRADYRTGIAARLDIADETTIDLQLFRR